MKKDLRAKIKKEPIYSWKDPRVSCFHASEYNVKGIQCPALVYFIQFAIRSDLRKAVGSSAQRDNPRIRLTGYLELEERMQDVLALIRTKHIVDENDLASIGLSLYHFPTVCHFLHGTERPVFVREANVKEIRCALDFAYAKVYDSDLWKYASGEVRRADDHEDVDRDAVHAIIDYMSLTQLQRETQPKDVEVADERLFFVDLSAPVSILKKQFLAAIERIPRQKVTMGADFSDLADLGVLPYIDLEDWQQWVHRGKVKRGIQIELIFPSEGNARKLTERTIPLAEKMLDASSAPFTYLITEAAEDFDKVRDYIHQQKQVPDADAESEQRRPKGDLVDEKFPALRRKADEVLARWLPRTYPYNIPDLKRAALVFPSEAENIKRVLELVESKLSCSASERIADSEISASDGSAFLRVMKVLVQPNDEEQVCMRTETDESQSTGDPQLDGRVIPFIDL